MASGEDCDAFVAGAAVPVGGLFAWLYAGFLDLPLWGRELDRIGAGT